jgi:hypothetical protein
MWNISRITSNMALLCAALAVAVGADLARAESTGGSIGSNEKTLSGAVKEPHSAAPERSEGRSQRARRSSPQGGGGGGGGVARFDGTWTFVTSAGCRASGNGSVTVSRGQISGGGLSGTVSSNGAFRIVSNAGGITVTGGGRVAGGTGSGRYRESGGCTGTIRAIKNG